MAVVGFIMAIPVLIGLPLLGAAIQRRLTRKKDENRHGSIQVDWDRVPADIAERKIAEEKLKDSEERYRLLQESLDHFSQDLFKVMKVSDLESRFIIELKDILQLEEIYIIEIDDRLNLYSSTGGAADFHELILQNYDQRVPIGEIVKIELGSFVKIGETNGRIILLCIENERDISEILPQRIWLQTICRYVSVLYDNLFTIEDLGKELEQRSQEKSTPRWILRLLFLVAEKERMKLSADLHDSVLQNQIIWYRKLQSIHSDFDLTPGLKQEIEGIEHGFLEIISQIRATCNDLRPPYLKEQGLIKALESLFLHTMETADCHIEFNYGGLKHELSEEEMITLYRIAQELLANARKHSNATKVEFMISSINDIIYFCYQDDGIGMNLDRAVDTFQHIGLSGIKKRVDSLEGELEMYSAPGKGVNLLISIPIANKNVQKSMLFEVFK